MDPDHKDETSVLPGASAGSLRVTATTQGHPPRDARRGGPRALPVTAEVPTEASEALHWLFTFHNFNIFATLTGSSPDNPVFQTQMVWRRLAHGRDRRRKPTSLLPREGEQPKPPDCHGDETSGRPTEQAGQRWKRVTHKGFDKGADSSVEKGSYFQQAETEECHSCKELRSQPRTSYRSQLKKGPRRKGTETS